MGSFATPKNIINLAAGSDLSSSQYKALVLSSDGAVDVAGANVSIIGFNMTKPTAGKAAEIASIGGGAKAIAGGTITAGDLLKTDSAGDVVTASVGDTYCALALESAVDNDVFNVLVIPPHSTAANAAIVPLHKFNATTAPTINDDSGDGYSVGSRWVDVTHNRTYVCVDATLGAAVWQGLTYNVFNVLDFGATGDGSTDDTAAIQAALDAARYQDRGLGFAQYSSVFIPSGRYVVSSPLEFYQSQHIYGDGMLDGGTRISFQGSNGESAFKKAASDGNSFSGVRIENIRIEDDRTSPTSGSAVLIEFGYNDIFINRVMTYNFPIGFTIDRDATNVGSSDCITISDCWTISSVSGAIGIDARRFDNYLKIERYKADLSGTAAIQITGVANYAAVCVIDTVKHEPNDDATPTILLNLPAIGHCTISNVLQSPQGSSLGGPVIQTAGSSGNREVVLRNIAGSKHNTQASSKETFKDGVNSGSTDYWGEISQGVIDKAARLYVERTFNATPQNTLYGNLGDIVVNPTARPTHYVKTRSNGATNGWAAFAAFFKGSTSSVSINVAPLASQQVSVTVPDTFIGNLALAMVDAAIPQDIYLSARVTATNTVVVDIVNNSASTWTTSGRTITAITISV